MACWDGWTLDVEEGDEESECPDCGEETVNGSAKYGCSYSPQTCVTCGARPCDLSC